MFHSYLLHEGACSVLMVFSHLARFVTVPDVTDSAPRKLKKRLTQERLKSGRLVYTRAVYAGLAWGCSETAPRSLFFVL